MTFQEFPKMGRLFRRIVITEKIDGTNAQIYIIKPEVEIQHFENWTAHVNGHLIWAGSRNRWITPENDNFGFARWVKENADEIVKLGSGRHFGEWWGSGIQRAYGLKGGDKRFSLFNVDRWHLSGQDPIEVPQTNPSIKKFTEELPACVGLVPKLYDGLFSTEIVAQVADELRVCGSKAMPGFMNPEGVVVFHTAANVGFKMTLENDGIPKSLAHPAC